MKVCSLFAGIGGFDLAFTRQGHDIVYVNEWDEYAAQTYEKNFKVKPDIRDIKRVIAKRLPDFDILVGGFPCQAFSIAGKRRGFEDTRGTMFYEIARILRAKRPTYLLLENVKGLLSHNNGQTFQTIMRTLDELGYDLQWQVCNSKDFGVPQSRERVFIVGHLRDKPRPKIFPIPSINSLHLEEITQEVSDAQRIYRISGIGKTIKALGGGLGAKTGMYQMDDLRVRRLTPLECERLQGFPDGWTDGSKDNERYKQLGNAVTVNVVEEIIKRLDK